MNDTPRYDSDDVKGAALARLDFVAETVLGTIKKPGRRELRWGGKDSAFGTVTVNASSGLFHIKETGQGGDVLALWALHMGLPDTKGGNFSAVLASLGDFLGVLPVSGQVDDAERTRQRVAIDRARAEREAVAQVEAAKVEALRGATLAAMQAAAGPVAGTIAETYLRSRGIVAAIPDAFAGFIPADALGSYRKGLVQSDAAALVIWARDADGVVIGAQRVLLTSEGRKRLVDTDDGQAAKFTTGRGDGVFVALPCVDPASLGGALVIGEGPETAAAIWQASGAETWCVFGSGGWAGVVDLLPRDRRVIFAPDADAIGSQAWQAFQRGLSDAVAAGVESWVSETPARYGPKADAGDVLEGDGDDAVRAMLAGARAADAPFFPASAPNDQRDVIGAEMRDYIRGWIFSNQGDEVSKNALIRGSQGLGKTTAALLALVDVVEGVALMAFPTREKALEEFNKYHAKKLPFSPRPILYRARDADRSDGGEGAMCERHAEATEMIRHALEPNLLCEGCPFRVGCPYREQSAMLARNRASGVPMVIFGAHELAFDAAPFTPDFAIIDEMPARGIVRTTPRIDPDDFSKHKLPLKEGTAPEAVAQVLTLVCDALCDLATAGEVLAPLRDVIEATRKAIQYAPTFQPMPDDTAATIKRKVEGFRNDYDKARRIRAALAAVLTDIDAGFKAVQSITRTPSNWTATRIASPRIDCPILAMDGTASPLLTRAWLGDDFEDKAFRVERNAEVVQVVGKSYSTQSLTGDLGKYQHKTPDDKARFEDNAKRLRGSLAKVIEAKENAGLIAAKEVKKLMVEALPSTVETAHFNALRGLNSLENCENLSVVGRMQPPAYEIGRIAGAYGAALGFKVSTTADYIDVTRRLRMRDGSTHPVEVKAYPDAIGDEVLRQIRDAEIEQAADRCRPIHNRRSITILSNSCCDFTVDRVIKHRDFVNGGNRFERAFVASGGMLRLSAAGMSADAPEIFSTAKCAKRWVEKQNFRAVVSDFLNSPLSQIEYLFGKRGHLIPSQICSVKIRIEGQRGKIIPALVLSQKENAEAAAREAWGDLAAFELVAVNGVPVEDDDAPGDDITTAEIITLSRSLEASGVLSKPRPDQCRIIAKVSAMTGNDAAAVAARLGIHHCNFDERGAA